MSQSSKLSLPLITAGIIAAGGGGYYYATGTPTYSLYQLEQTIAKHDVEGFNRYFDSQAVVDTLYDDAWEDVRKKLDVTPGTGKPTTIWERAGAEIGKRFTDAMIGAVKPRVKAMAVSIVDDEIKKSILKLSPETPSSAAPPSFELVEVKTEGKAAWATVKSSTSEIPLTLTLSQMPDRHWKIVAVDYAWMKARIKHDTPGLQ